MDNFFDTLKFYFYYWDSSFADFPIIIRIAFFLIIVLVILYISTFTRIIFVMGSLHKKKKLTQRIEKQYADKIKMLLFSDPDMDPEDIKHKLQLENKKLDKWDKIEFTNLLLAIKSTKSANINLNNYLGIIEELSLVSFWESRLKSRSLKMDMQALRKLDSLGVDIPGSVLMGKVQEVNPDLRKHAKSEYIRFAQHDAFKYLEEGFDGDLNPLDHIRIHAALKERAKVRPLPPLIRWVLTSENEDFICFLITEIGLFNQIESAQQLDELYKTTKSNKVKAQIAQTMGVLKYTPAMDTLIVNYESNPEFLQLNIINAMGQFATPQALAFLERIYNQPSDDYIFIKIVQNIYKIDSRKETYLRLKDVVTNIFRKSVFVNAEQEAVNNHIA